MFHSKLKKTISDLNSTLVLFKERINNLENENKWILGNLNYMGYFRVNYDKQNWMKIINQLKVDHTVFSPTERAGLIFDSFTLARLFNFKFLH